MADERIKEAVRIFDVPQYVEHNTVLKGNQTKVMCSLPRAGAPQEILRMYDSGVAT